MLAILTKNKSFRHLWLGQLVSSFGDRLTQMGILTFVMINSGDKGEKMAMVTFFTLLPFSLFGPFFGALADRYSRKTLMIIADVARAIMVVLVPLIWINTHSVTLVVFWFFVLGSLTALFTPAKMSIITNITDKDILLQANSLIVSTGMVTTLVGTLLAGALINITGVKAAFYINSFTYLISALFIVTIAYTRERVAPQLEDVYIKIWDDIKIGIGYIKRHNMISSLIMLSSVSSFISSFAYILILNYGASILGQKSLGMGALLSAAGFGMILGSAILFKRKDKTNYEKALYLSYLIIGIFLLAFMFKPNFQASLFLLFCGGIGVSVLTITLDTIFQRIIPDDLKGKAFAVRGMFTNAVFLIFLLVVGILIKYVPVTMLFALVGAISIMAALRIFLYERRWGYAILRTFLRFLMKILFNFKVSGLENIPKKRRFVFAGNHTSVVDAVALMCAYPGRIYFLAAESLFKTGFWGWCARRLGYISVKKDTKNIEAIRTAVQILKAGYSIGIFPEGHITVDGRLDVAKEGVALIARLGNADVIPFAIEGAYEAWPLPKKYPKRFPIEVCFGKPIDISSSPEQEQLMAEVMEEIARVKLHLEREGYLRVDPDEIVKHLINIG